MTSPRDQIKDATSRFGRLHQRIHETYVRRTESSCAWADWEAACREFHGYPSPMSDFESADGRERLRAGDSHLLEHAIAFLEVDPFVFRSGYAKATIIRCIKHLLFTPDQLERLRWVVVQVIQKSDRAEFRAYCRLAASIHSMGFEEQMRGFLGSPDSGVRRRARFLVDYLEQWRCSQKKTRHRQ
jgi:hypothetical protein